MAGFANFKYYPSIIPTHTNSSLNSMKVLTAQNVIAKNALIFMIRYFPNSPPKSVRGTITNKGSFTYYVISRGVEGVSKCLRLITGGGGLAVDYVIIFFTLL